MALVPWRVSITSKTDTHTKRSVFLRCALLKMLVTMCSRTYLKLLWKQVSQRKMFFFLCHFIRSLLKQIACTPALRREPRGNVWGIHYSKQLRRCDCPVLIAFILIIIPEVIMSWILEAATRPHLHSALTLNGVIVIIAFMHGKVHFLR